MKVNWNFNFFSNHNVAKSSFGLCSLAPGPIKGSGAKNKSHTNFYEHCDLRKEYIYAEILDFWRRSWSSNWLMGVPIDFNWLQLTLLNPHDSLQVKWIVKIFLNFCQKNFQLTFSLQLTLVNCTWSGPKSAIYFINLGQFKNWPNSL